MKCYKCNQEIAAGRLKALPTTKVCVECSGTKMLRSITTVNGEKDNTWNDIVFVDEKTYNKIVGLDKPSIEEEE